MLLSCHEQAEVEHLASQTSELQQALDARSAELEVWEGLSEILCTANLHWIAVASAEVKTARQPLPFPCNESS